MERECDGLGDKLQTESFQFLLGIYFKKNRQGNELVDLWNEFPVVDPMLACRESKQQKSQLQWRE